jgi:Tol biopolymer transport system component
LSLSPGTRLGGYEILSPLGSGGMGEVYRARDVKLGRDVAVKVLPESLAQDPEALARFEREARSVAALNHPNILSIHDFGEHEGVAYSVTELLEGETLRARLEGGSLSRRRAIDYAVQIASGLAAAHEKGIIHRDLKPENIFVTADERIKILDFGLAKSLPGFAAGGATHAPTIDAATEPGAVMGTVGYMSPEQVRGKALDHRSDIFSFGAVLYEMLSGKRAFRRDTAAESMTAILKEDPPELSESARHISPALDRIVRHCLEKSPEARFQSARDVAFDLSTLASDTSSQSAKALPGATRRKWRVGVWGSALLTAVAVGIVVGLLLGRRAAAPAMTFKQLTVLPGAEQSPTLAPDGKSFVFAAGATGKEHLFLQRVDGSAALDLTKDSKDGNVEPAISPDGSAIAFRSTRDGGGVFVMGASGENVRRLTDFGHDPAWSPDGKEIAVGTDQGGFPFGRALTSELFVVNAESGARKKIFDGDAVQPSWSSDGERIAFWGLPEGTSKRQIWTISAKPRPGEKPLPVTDGTSFDWSPVWLPDGKHLDFLSDRGGSLGLWEVAVDEKTGRVSGDARPITLPAAEVDRFSLSRDGRRIVYATASTLDEIQRVHIDPASGTALPGTEVVFRGTLSLANPDPSPDGRWLVFRTQRRQEDLFVVGTDGSGLHQLTNDPAMDRGPEWSPDGRRILFYSNRGGRYGIWTINADGSGIGKLAEIADETPIYPRWAPDGKEISFQGDRSSYILSLAPGSKPQKLPLIEGKREFVAFGWSPDGRLITGSPPAPAFAGDGVWTYSVADGRYERLTQTGTAPVFIPPGKLIAYLSLDGIRVVDVRTKESHLLVTNEKNNPVTDFAVARDGRSLYYVTEDLEGDIWAATKKTAE